MNTVLFVDDQPELLTSMRHMLRRYRDQWDMHFVGSGAEAMTLLGERSVNIVISDMRMPGMDGAALLDEVQRLHPGVARVMLSGYSETEAVLRAVPVSHQFLSKPCRPKELQRVISRMLSAQALTNNPTIGKLIGGIKKLPTPPRVYAQVCALLAEDNVAHADVANVIASDIAISARVLQLVNSAYFRTAREFECVTDAVVYLGFDVVSQLVLAAEVFGAEEGANTNGVDLERARSHALATSALVGAIAPPAIRKCAQTAALLHDVGILVWSQMGELDAAGVDMDWSAWEHDKPHGLLGAYLLQLWGLPGIYVETARHHHAPWQLELTDFDVVSAVHVADALVNANDRNQEPDCDALKAFLEPFGLESKLPHWISLSDPERVGAAA